MIVLMIIATIILVFFLLCFISADEEARDYIIESRLMDYEEEALALEMTMELLIAEMKKRDEMNNKQRLREGKRLKKKYDEILNEIENYKNGKISLINLIPIAGYGVIKRFRIDAKNSVLRYLIKQCSKYREKNQAIKYAYYVASSLIGYVSLGFALFFATLALALAMELGSRTIVVGIVVFGIFALLGYIPLDNVNRTVKTRKEDIERHFPQVISKLTLLTEAGIEMSKAWNLTSSSGNGVLYMEMNRVNKDLSNNVKPELAYMGFIQRCSNTYTSKLASLIVQNMFKGNSEMVRQLSELNTECWNEFRNNTQRMGEKVQSKLFIPTLLMFAAIIILIIVPVLSAFSSL